MIYTLILGGFGLSGVRASTGSSSSVIPNRPTALALEFIFKGRPFCEVEAKPLLTYSLDYAFKGRPFTGTQ